MVGRHLSASSLGSNSCFAHLLFCVCVLARSVCVFVCYVKLDLALMNFTFLNPIVSLVIYVDS